MTRRIGVRSTLPRGFEPGAAVARRAKDPERIPGYMERRILGPAQRTFGRTHLVGAERLAVRLKRVLLLRAAVADMSAGDDQRRAILDGARRGQRAVDGRHILAVDTLHMPAARLEASADIFEEGQ